MLIFYAFLAVVGFTAIVLAILSGGFYGDTIWAALVVVFTIIAVILSSTNDEPRFYYDEANDEFYRDRRRERR
jgi:hypothetical protein